MYASGTLCPYHDDIRYFAMHCALLNIPVLKFEMPSQEFYYYNVIVILMSFNVCIIIADLIDVDYI